MTDKPEIARFQLSISKSSYVKLKQISADNYQKVTDTLRMIINRYIDENSTKINK